MIERKFVAERLREYQIHEYINEALKNVGHSHTKVVPTPLGEKIIIFASKPGLVVGRKGENIKKLTASIKKQFKLENPQIEISEVENPNIDAKIVAERIASTIERFGAQKFKAIAHQSMQDALGSGAMGIEIKISGKVPSARAKTWRFYKGYLKKRGQIALDGVHRAQSQAMLKSGIVGIQVAIMPGDVKRPDDVKLKKMETLGTDDQATSKPAAQRAGAPVEGEKE